MQLLDGRLLLVNHLELGHWRLLDLISQMLLLLVVVVHIAIAGLTIVTPVALMIVQIV